MVHRQRRWGVAMRQTSAQRWEEAAPLIQGWGLVKGFVFWEAKAFVGGMGEGARR